jgi:hypothetical protein
MVRHSPGPSSFQPTGEEELSLHLAPGTKTGLLAVQEVAGGCFQAKVRKKGGGGFVSLPACGSRLLAAWFVAKALKARDEGTLETSFFKASMKEVRPPQPCPPLLIVLTAMRFNCCHTDRSAVQGEAQGECQGAEQGKRRAPPFCFIFSSIEAHTEPAAGSHPACSERPACCAASARRGLS